MNKKIYSLSYCLAILSLFCISNISFAQSYSGGSGTESDPYLISTAADLTQLATSTNSGTSTAGVYYQMTDNITLSETWTPIGHTNQFAGTFDGNGHSISNLTITDSDAYMTFGLFGRIAANGKVSGITINSGNVNAYMCTGAIAGMNIGTIENCVNHASISALGFYAGGIVGGNYGTVKHCINYGSVIVNGNNGCGAGGIAGTSIGIVECCGNHGDIRANLIDAGGIVGSVDKPGSIVGNITEYKIVNCYNRGAITVGQQQAGGIVGMVNDRESIPFLIKNCYNASSVTGPDCIGAIIGDALSTVTQCENVYYDDSFGLAGIGNNGYNINVSNMPKSTAELQSQSFIDNYLGTGDGEGVWMRDINNVNDGYPIFNDGSATNIDESVAANLNIYPNPATDYFSTEGEDIQEVSIYNAAGEIIRTINAQTSDIQNINISELNSGIYFVSIKTKTANAMKQIVKM